MDERFRDALRRNALLSQVLAEGYLPSADAALRARLRVELARRRRRPLLAAAAVAIVALAALYFRPAPAPVVAPSPAPVPLLEIVRTRPSPLLEIVSTDAPLMEVTRTTVVAFEVVGDEELLKSNRVVAIVGHPGGPRRVVYLPPTP